MEQGIERTEIPTRRSSESKAPGAFLTVGEGVQGISIGQRVAWCYTGSYAERIAIPATSLVPIPDAIDDRVAAS